MTDQYRAWEPGMQYHASDFNRSGIENPLTGINE